MAATREEPEGWSTRANPPRANPSTPPPDVDATGRFFDPLDPGVDRADQESDARRREAPPPGGLVEEPVYARPRRRPVSQGSARRRRTKPVRRVKRVLRHVDPFSVFKVSLMFYGCFLLVWLVIVAILYWIVDAAGFFDIVENVRDAFVFEGRWEVSLGFVEKWAFFIGVVVALGMSLLNLFLAFLYNVVADVIGGIEVTFVERDV